MTSDVTQPHDGPESNRSGAVLISERPPVALLIRRPDLAGVGIGTNLAERALS